MDLFIVRVPDRSKYYCKVPAWWAQYEATVLLFVPTPLILSYYSSLSLQDSGNDRTRVWTIPRGEAGPSYFTLNTQSDTLSGDVLFRLSDNILDALKYFGL